MKKFFVVFAILVASLATSFAQDLSPKIFGANIQFVLITPDQDGGNQLQWNDNFICKLKFNNNLWQGYVFASDFCAKEVIKPNPNSIINTDVDGSENDDVIYGELTHRFASIGGGVSYGTDDLRFFVGTGYSLNKKLRANGGIYWQTKQTSLSAFADIASADSRYDVKFLLSGQEPHPINLRVGFYINSRLGIGPTGQFDIFKNLTIAFGFGHNSMAKTKVKFNIWSGVNLTM